MLKKFVEKRSVSVIKKKKNEKRSLGNFYSPYQDYGEDINIWFEAYKNDVENNIEIKGKVYSKIISKWECYIFEDFTLFVSFEPQENLRIGDTLIDEIGREFKIKAFERFGFTGKTPNWAFEISSMAIIGQDYSIGNYITKK